MRDWDTEMTEKQMLNGIIVLETKLREAEDRIKKLEDKEVHEAMSCFVSNEKLDALAAIIERKDREISALEQKLITTDATIAKNESKLWRLECLEACGVDNWGGYDDDPDVTVIVTPVMVPGAPQRLNGLDVFAVGAR